MLLMCATYAAHLISYVHLVPTYLVLHVPHVHLYYLSYECHRPICLISPICAACSMYLSHVWHMTMYLLSHLCCPPPYSSLPRAECPHL